MKSTCFKVLLLSMFMGIFTIYVSAQSDIKKQSKSNNYGVQSSAILKTKYDRIINYKLDSYQRLINWGISENLAPVSTDKEKVLLLIIDPQNDFIEGGSLGVPGAKADMERISTFNYKNINNITQIMCSLDTHSISQIFHAC